MVLHMTLPERVTLKANFSVFVDSFDWLAAFWSYPLLPAKAEDQRRWGGSAVKPFDYTGHDHEWWKGDSTKR
jgi:hypothetical protein